MHRVRVQRSYAPAELRTLLGELAADEPAFAGAFDESLDESPPVTAPPTQPAQTTPVVQSAGAASVTATPAFAPAFSVLPGESIFDAKRPVETPPIVPSAAPTAIAPTAPVCPKCGCTMVLRTARQGANRGGQFWGCSKYPKCCGIVAIT